jgi:hypothetical protein
MLQVRGITIVKWSLATLLLSQTWLTGGCEDPDTSMDEDPEDPRAWTGYTSEEYPPLSCPDQHAVRGAHCTGGYCDNIALYCSYTGRYAEDPTWMPYFSEEGSGTTDEGHCLDNDRWLTGISCNGGYCDNLSLLCARVPGSSTGGCTWSGWYSEEDGPFVAPVGYYVKGIECDGGYCDNLRYRYCWMY